MWSPQFLVSLWVLIFCLSGGVGLATQRQAVAQMVERRQARLMAAEKRRVARLARERMLASTYSWISPVNCHAHPCLALTFDDGPNPMTTPKVLDILERERVPASFFVVGSRVPGSNALLKRMWHDSDEIGNHSWSHPDFTTLPVAAIEQQIAQTQAVIQAAGVPTPTLFRPPYGAVNPTVIANVPLTIMFWNEDPRDWAASSPQAVERAVLNSARPGGVVDMHDIYASTAAALDPIIKKLKTEHYQFVTVSQLLGLKPGQKGEFYGRPVQNP